MKTNPRYRNLRNLVFERDSYTCILCSRAASDLHHVISRSQGGRDHPHNLVSVCRFHHLILHGNVVIAYDFEPVFDGTHSTCEAKQIAIEYVCDCYADQCNLFTEEGWKSISSG